MISKDKAVQMVFRLPVVHDWVEFDRQVYFAGINIEATMKAGKPMVNLYYCATEALNEIVLKTVQWDKSRFSKSELGGWEPAVEKYEDPFPELIEV